MDRLAIVDIETTGGVPQRDRVIEVGVVLVDGVKKVGEWSSLINPRRPISPFITNITGISSHDVVEAPEFAQIAQQLGKLLEDRIFVAHNVRFDYSFLLYEYQRLNQEFKYPHACSVRLARKLFPGHRSYSLGKISASLGLVSNIRHRALADAELVYQLLQKGCKYHPTEYVFENLRQLTKRPYVPSQIPEDQIHQLPQTPGIYIISDKSGQPIYIGKSINLRGRVKSHFINSTHSVKELRLSQQAHKIDYQTCAGELEALLLESNLVKQHLPVFNVKLRQTKGLWAALAETDTQGYLRLACTNITKLEYEDRHILLGLSPHKRKLQNLLEKIHKTYQLCPRLLGLEKGKGRCFASQLDMCRGACVGQITAKLHNQLLQAALKAYSINDWPYPGPIVVSEYNPDTDLQAHHLVDRWVVYQTAREISDIELQLTQVSHPIDLDQYKILKTYLKQPGIKVKPVLFEPEQ